jgi:hypothetical protein
MPREELICNVDLIHRKTARVARRRFEIKIKKLD